MRSAEAHRVAEERLAGVAQRYTPNRRRIVESLAAARSPLTLPELLATTPELSQSSTYRNLALLEELGVVRRIVHGGDHAHYELGEHLAAHHHHLVCVSCGTIADVVLDDPLEARLERAFDGVADAHGFRPEGHVIDIYGRCQTCA